MRTGTYDIIINERRWDCTEILIEILIERLETQNADCEWDVTGKSIILGSKGSCNAFNENMKGVWIPHDNSEWAVKGAADVFGI